MKFLLMNVLVVGVDCGKRKIVVGWINRWWETWFRRILLWLHGWQSRRSFVHSLPGPLKTFEQTSRKHECHMCTHAACQAIRPRSTIPGGLCPQATGVERDCETISSRSLHPHLCFHRWTLQYKFAGTVTSKGIVEPSCFHHVLDNGWKKSRQ